MVHAASLAGAVTMSILASGTTCRAQTMPPVAQVAFGHLDSAAPLHVVALPVNVAFPNVVRLDLDDKDPKPLELGCERCLSAACFADAVAGDGALGRWRAATAPAQPHDADAAGREVAVPISFRGMPQALDAPQKQP